MLISELLKENEHPKHKSALPKAASINDEPEELKLDGELDDGDGDTNELIDDFKKHAADMGDNLYALSAWDYYGDAINPEDDPATGPNRIASKTLADSGINELTKVDRDSYLENARIDAAILNSDTGDIAVFVADPGTESSHISDGYIEAFEPSQAAKLNKIEDVGKKYVRYAAACIDSDYRKHYQETVKLRNQLLGLLGMGEGYSAPVDPDEANKYSAIDKMLANIRATK
jgi:hypothetical protein